MIQCVVNKGALMGISRIGRLSKESIEFLINFEEIMKTKINPRNYRFKIDKTVEPFNNNVVKLKIKDCLSKKSYGIILDDYAISVNPFLSQKTYRQLMNYKWNTKDWKENLSYYEKGYITYLRYLILSRLKQIKTKIEKGKLDLKLSEIIRYTEQSLKVREGTIRQVYSGNDFKSLIDFVKSPEFLEVIKASKKFASFRKEVQLNDFKNGLQALKLENENVGQMSEDLNFNKRLRKFLKDGELISKNSAKPEIKTYEK